MSDAMQTQGMVDEEGSPERSRIDPELVDRLMAEAGNDAELLGPDGLLSELTKAVLERALAAEMTDHLGYEKHDPAGRGSGNSRNGTSPKTVLTDLGAVELDVPRDRNGEFDPKIVPKGVSRLAGFNERIIALYARGMTTRDIQAWLRELYGVEVSADLISTVTDAVLDELREWQARPLDPIYPIVYLDAIVCKVRDEGVVRNKAAHIAMGVDIDGRKTVLGIWIETTEGAKFWLRVITELRNRGVEDVLFVCCDGLKGLPDAIEAVWPDAVVQTCVVHLIRGSLRYCGYKERKAVIAALKTVYRAATEAAAEKAFADFEARYGTRYPGIVRLWRDAWERFTPFLAYPPEIRTVIYTTNAIESLNYQLRKITKNRGHFPNDDALLKLLYLGIRNIGTDRRVGSTGGAGWHWRQALNQFEIYFPGRLQLA
jgi:putative transposase